MAYDDTGYAGGQRDVPWTKGRHAVYEQQTGLTNDHTLGEHASTVNFKGLPTDEDMIVVGMNIRISRARCQQIIEEVREGTRELSKFF